LDGWLLTRLPDDWLGEGEGEDGDGDGDELGLEGFDGEEVDLEGFKGIVKSFFFFLGVREGSGRVVFNFSA
jgi:hypothetical protein